MNKTIFDLNKIVDEIVSMTKKRIDVYIEEKQKELTEELELKEIEKFMKKSEPKLILNLQVDSEELDQKVKLAMDKYIEDVIVGNLDDEIEKIVTKRIGALVSADRWNPNRKIKDKTLDTYVKEATEKVICDVIDKNIKDIFAKKVAEML